ncbi:MAG: cob(I)yrinic acid a,c-diamide adenosyltransferase [Eubacteriales bacterium]|nr:cob(I)yrinic acid a,c-diamide adenosyltransferase [Eubacteriales bacterium]
MTSEKGQAAQTSENAGASEKEEDAVGCGGRKDDVSKEGCVHIYCGDGKGKTTCVMGLTVRAAGAGKKVLLHQFLKGNDSSERKIIEGLSNVTVVPGPGMEKFTFRMNEEELQALHEQNDAMLERLFEKAKDYDMLVMDESVYAMSMGLLTEEKVLECLQNRPGHLEVVMSGRNPSETLIEQADYVSEICKRKHPFDRGLSSRVGIEK